LAGGRWETDIFNLQLLRLHYRHIIRTKTMSAYFKLNVNSSSLPTPLFIVVGKIQKNRAPFAAEHTLPLSWWVCTRGTGEWDGFTGLGCNYVMDGVSNRVYVIFFIHNTSVPNYLKFGSHSLLTNLGILRQERVWPLPPFQHGDLAEHIVML